MATDEEVNKRQAEIAALREQNDAARLAAQAAQREHGNEITMAQLDAEEARLRAEIEQHEALADPKRLQAAVDAQRAQITGEGAEEKFGKGVEVQHQADGSVIVLSVKVDEAPQPPPAVTSDTPPEPTPDVVPEPRAGRNKAATTETE